MKTPPIMIIMIVVTVLTIILVGIGVQMSEKQFEKFDAEVGNQVILRKDTLFVMDYSIFNDSYTLENGLKIDREFYETLEKIER
jgi:hypothetical protein